ncbi:unnamed protein product [Cyprideis torosa]|uniref:Uncharacterized protein n=1 Tax=Cyprideis torosa TaxID=163714 RepID=A0A7R8ZN20_9CRUS|nr:unnamed protein product [Cyprideis torosa]CAG0895209.1 unnamed protein product [Cyprideis torosa]
MQGGFVGEEEEPMQDPTSHEPGIGSTPDQATNNVDSGWEVSPEAVAEQVQMLVDMGFRREEASRALEASRYDIAAATSILMQDPSSRQEGTGERGGI